MHLAFHGTQEPCYHDARVGILASLSQTDVTLNTTNVAFSVDSV